MTFKEFVKDHYPIKEKLALMMSDPVKQVMEQDDLPCDCVMYVDGQMQKCVYISDEDYRPILDLLSYYPEEVRDMQDEDFKTAYFAYMDNIEITDMSIANIMTAAKDYKANKEKRKELLARCTQ